MSIARRLASVLLLAAAAAAAAGNDAEPAYRHRAEAGDTLIGLGRRFLADPAAWPELQRLNGVRDPRRIPVGAAIAIPLRLMRGEAAPAAVTAVSGGVRSGDRTVAAGQSLSEGSELATGSDGFVTVRLVDGTVLRLRAGARMRIDESRRYREAIGTRSGVRLERGRAEIDAEPARSGQPGFRIDTPQGVLGVRGTRFRVEVGDDRTKAEVLEGVVVAGGRGGDAQRLDAGTGTVIDAAGRVEPPRALPVAPDLSRLPARHERPLVRLNWPALPGAQGYRVQVAADEGFEALLVDLRTDGPEARLAGLADGRHPLRLRAIDGRGLEGRDAQAVLVLKARPEPPLPSSPAPGAVIIGSSAGLVWAASSEASRYRLQMARADAGGDSFAAPLVDLRDLEGTSHRVDGLPPGAYRWRLASVRADGDQGPFGDELGFELRLPPPQPVAPPPPSPPSLGDDAVRFFWQGQPGQRFEFQLARDPGFTVDVVTHELAQPAIELPLPGVGRFHVRLRTREADGFAGPWSAPQHFDVVACVRDGHQACVRVEGGTLQLR